MFGASLRTIPEGVDGYAALEELRGQLAQHTIAKAALDEATASYCRSEHMLVRFLVAHSWNAKDAAEALQEHYTWLVEKRISDLLVDPFPEAQQIKRYYPQTFHGTDKLGRPIYIERIGMLDAKALLKAVPSTRLLDYICASSQMQVCLRLPACSVARGEVVDTSLNILDLQGLSFSVATNGEARAILKEILGIQGRHYPGLTGQTIIINAPAVFNLTWAFAKPFMSEDLLSRIAIFGTRREEYSKALLDVVDADQLPALFGGQCICDGQDPQSCMTCLRGPWTDSDVCATLRTKPLDQVMTPAGAAEAHECLLRRRSGDVTVAQEAMQQPCSSEAHVAELPEAFTERHVEDVKPVASTISPEPADTDTKLLQPQSEDAEVEAGTSTAELEESSKQLHTDGHEMESRIGNPQPVEIGPFHSEDAKLEVSTGSAGPPEASSGLLQSCCKEMESEAGVVSPESVEVATGMQQAHGKDRRQEVSGSQHNIEQAELEVGNAGTGQAPSAHGLEHSSSNEGHPEASSRSGLAETHGQQLQNEDAALKATLLEICSKDGPPEASSGLLQSRCEDMESEAGVVSPELLEMATGMQQAHGKDEGQEASGASGSKHNTQKAELEVGSAGTGRVPSAHGLEHSSSNEVHPEASSRSGLAETNGQQLQNEGATLEATLLETCSKDAKIEASSGLLQSCCKDIESEAGVVSPESLEMAPGMQQAHGKDTRQEASGASGSQHNIEKAKLEVGNAGIGQAPSAHGLEHSSSNEAHPEASSRSGFFAETHGQQLQNEDAELEATLLETCSKDADLEASTGSAGPPEASSGLLHSRCEDMESEAGVVSPESLEMATRMQQAHGEDRGQEASGVSGSQHNIEKAELEVGSAGTGQASSAHGLEHSSSNEGHPEANSSSGLAETHGQQLQNEDAALEATLLETCGKDAELEVSTGSAGPPKASSGLLQSSCEDMESEAGIVSPESLEMATGMQQAHGNDWGQEASGASGSQHNAEKAELEVSSAGTGQAPSAQWAEHSSSNAAHLAASSCSGLEETHGQQLQNEVSELEATLLETCSKDTDLEASAASPDLAETLIVVTEVQRKGEELEVGSSIDGPTGTSTGVPVRGKDASDNPAFELQPLDNDSQKLDTFVGTERTEKMPAGLHHLPSLEQFLEAGTSSAAGLHTEVMASICCALADTATGKQLHGRDAESEAQAMGSVPSHSAPDRNRLQEVTAWFQQPRSELGSTESNDGDKKDAASTFTSYLRSALVPAASNGGLTAVFAPGDNGGLTAAFAPGGNQADESWSSRWLRPLLCFGPRSRPSPAARPGPEMMFKTTAEPDESVS